MANAEEFFVDFNGLTELTQNLTTQHRTLQASWDDVVRNTASLQSTWSGTAQQGFETVSKEVTTLLGEMWQALVAATNHTGTAHDTHLAAEINNVKMWNQGL